MSLAPVSLIPLLLADSMGIRRFATLQGIQGFILFLAVAPVHLYRDGFMT